MIRTWNLSARAGMSAWLPFAIKLSISSTPPGKAKTAIRNGAAREPGQSVQRVSQGMSHKSWPAFSTEIRRMPARLTERMPRPFAFDNPGMPPWRA